MQLGDIVEIGSTGFLILWAIWANRRMARLEALIIKCVQGKTLTDKDLQDLTDRLY